MKTSVVQGGCGFIGGHFLNYIKSKTDSEIIVLDKGKIIQKGNHELLMNQNGYYKDVYSKQLTKKDDKI